MEQVPMEERIPDLIIEPSQGWLSLRFKELWEYKELLYFLAWRDIKVRYKQTVIGASWAVLQPITAMVIFSIFFGYLAKIPSDGIPYPIFVYCGLLPWQLFAYALTESSNSLVTNRQLITKVYFPRLLVPISTVLAGLVDFSIAFVVLIGMMFYYGWVPTTAVLALLFFLLLTVGTALGVGFWLSALNVKYRDIRYTIPFLTQVWLFATPVVYPSSLIPEPWRALYGLNPIAGVVEGFRWALLGSKTDIGPLLIVSSLVMVVILVGGLVYFRRVECTFTDVV
jgi:lipopolysaccharide transport system permease protein